MAKDFLAEHLELLGLSAADSPSSRSPTVVPSEVSGATHLYLRQRHARPAGLQRPAPGQRRPRRPDALASTTTSCPTSALGVKTAKPAPRRRRRGRRARPSTSRCRSPRRRARAGQARRRRPASHPARRAGALARADRGPADAAAGAARPTPGWCGTSRSTPSTASTSTTSRSTPATGEVLDPLRLGGLRHLPRLPAAGREPQPHERRCRRPTAACSSPTRPIATASPLRLARHQRRRRRRVHHHARQQRPRLRRQRRQQPAARRPARLRRRARLRLPDQPRRRAQHLHARRRSPTCSTGTTSSTTSSTSTASRGGRQLPGQQLRPRRPRQRRRPGRGAGRRRHQQRQLRHPARRLSGRACRCSCGHSPTRAGTATSTTASSSTSTATASPTASSAARPTSAACSNAQQPGEGLTDWWSLVYTARAGRRGHRRRAASAPTRSASRPPAPASAPSATAPTRRSTPGPTPASPAWPSRTASGSVWAQGAWEVYWALVDQLRLRPRPLQRARRRRQPARDALRQRGPEEHRLQPDLHPGPRRHHRRRPPSTTAARTSAACGRPSPASAWAPTPSAAARTAPTPPTASPPRPPAPARSIPSTPQIVHVDPDDGDLVRHLLPGRHHGRRRRLPRRLHQHHPAQLGAAGQQRLELHLPEQPRQPHRLRAVRERPGRQLPRLRDRQHHDDHQQRRLPEVPEQQDRPRRRLPRQHQLLAPAIDLSVGQRRLGLQLAERHRQHDRLRRSAAAPTSTPAWRSTKTETFSNVVFDQCPAGKKIVSGGCSDDFTSTTAESSYPWNDNGWVCNWITNLGSVTVYVLCEDP